MHLSPTWRWFYLPTILASFVLISASAREIPPSDDSLDKPEEVMPVMPIEVPPSTQVQPKWSAPQFSDQAQALGWTPEVFKIPEGMEERVQFWKDIYTKYTSDQGILHDSKYVNIVYESVDFSDITTNLELTPRQREKARRLRVDERKKEIVSRLKKLQGLKDSTGLEGEDLRFWEMYALVKDSKKFLEGARRGRLRFQLGQRNQFVAGIYQSGRYLRQMEEIFRQEGMPLELTRLPFVESSFNLRARSKVGASGLWQFMRSSAKAYMRIDSSADERNDPLRATRAAAKKLRENYQMLKSWPLAITAYNRGAAGVKRLTEKLGTTDLVELIDLRTGRFGFASASFYASFLAALDVERHADHHFGVVEILPELRGAEVQITKNQLLKDFIQWFNQDLALAQLLNPHVTDSVWKGYTPLTRKQFLRVPLLQESQARAAME